MEKQDDNKKEEVRHCAICDADREVIKVEKLPDRKQMTLECGHPYGEISVVINESIGISENLEYVILKDPVAEIRKAVNEQDYFKIVVYACAVLEYYGLKILIWDSKNAGNPLPTDRKRRKGDEWTLYEIINLLRERDKITDSEKQKLHDIRCLRNDFVHEEAYSIKITSALVGKVNALNNDIIYYVGYLKDKYDKMAPSPTP